MASSRGWVLVMLGTTMPMCEKVLGPRVPVGLIPVRVIEAEDFDEALDVVLVAVHLVADLVAGAVAPVVRVAHVTDGEVFRDVTVGQ